MSEAQRLLDTGWRQGSVFTANEVVGLPHGCKPDDRLIVLTQSCTVVSPRWDVDPHIEVARVTPLAKFNPRSSEAKGKNLRKLHVPLVDGEQGALAIDLNSRTFVDRRLFLEFEPDGTQPHTTEARRIGGWISRYYSRIALPNALVVVLREGVLNALKAVLDTQIEGQPLHERVSNIYIDWSPDDENGDPYEVSLLVLATDEAAAEFAGKQLTALIPASTSRLTITHDALSAESAFVSDVEGRVRFTEYDYLSDLADEDTRA